MTGIAAKHASARYAADVYQRLPVVVMAGAQRGTVGYRKGVRKGNGFVF